MSMDKYSQDDESLRLGLIDEESQLMRKMGGFMSSMEKTAEEERDMQRTESRLQQVRAKITEIDTKAKANKVKE